MPRCQRTLRALPEPPKEGCIPCPFCADQEVYQQVADTDLLQCSQVAFATLVRDFGKPGDAVVPIRLWHGLMPECVRCAGNRGYDIYLGADSDALQLRLQIGHEMFHRVCSQGRIFHWTHEALACVFAVRFLRQCGFCTYADAIEAAYYEQAKQLPLADLLDSDVALPPYPAGLYGRAYVTGALLLRAAGWSALSRLTAPNHHGQPVLPDVARWWRTLPSPASATVAELLSVTADFPKHSCR